MNHTPRRAITYTSLVALLLACALAPSLSRAQSAAKATPSPTPADARRGPVGTLKGRVVGDDGEPLAHASLYLYNRSWGTRSRQPPPPANSDEDGKFSFDELEPGLYGIRVRLPGYTAEAGADDNPAAAVYRVGDDVTIRLVKGGVITGTVTNADGEPIVGVGIQVTRLRTLDERPAPPLEFMFGEYATDDRGVYRIYGLPAGVYLVSAGGSKRWHWMPPTPYDQDAPTYFRSGTVDTAEEVTVRTGQEVSGVDLRYRGERGHAVSGALVYAPGKGPGESISISLSHAATSIQVASLISFGGENMNSFALEGVADGDYELRATRYVADGESATATPLRVSVRGADVTGLRLTFAPFGSVGGDLSLEPLREAAAECKTAERRALLPQEVLVALLREDRAATFDPRRPAPLWRRETSPDESGAFLVRTLEQGRYRIDARPADERWYVRDIQLAPQATTAAPANTSQTASPSSATRPPAPRNDSAATRNAANNAPRHTLDLKPGQQLTGLKVFVAEGAASLAGRVTPRDEATTLPASSQLRVHLVPAAREQADNPLRHYETTPAPDGSFSFKNLAPGRYLLLAREADADTPPTRPAAWDSATRARLRREAEAANITVELQPCQRATDLTARLQAPRE